VIAGQVTYNDAGHSAFVQAYSDGGAHTATLAGPGGCYELGVNAGDTWHVQAVGETISGTGALTETIFLKSVDHFTDYTLLAAGGEYQL
jgi:hypothetical protein